MGIKVPDEVPELPPADNFIITIRQYLGSCDGTLIAVGLCFKTGAQINAWYAAGRQCQTGLGICAPEAGKSEAIIQIV